ncbi:acyl-CoA dehydrogenase family protein [Zavarzinia compransoris]|uniref:Acyl-CoA dehydrogenase n=1 Tax=Zavarzinia compransoris TaxID=1264899 RepID=A0A317E1N7_9PROT|nr:acyl-CoA dehydrogenase family protein [Zavarzinia compransoris]PWR20978.1 acyl-CoA dehydrogenase [Zavarzinia compransoris]TDP44007.1 acyl-CoA dehydrogenase [Zavarzinia compransoris]
MPLHKSDLEAITAAVRRFVDERLIPAEARVAAADEIDPDIVDGMRELGLFGLSVPEEYGGLGLTMEEEVLVMLELGRASPAFRSLAATNVGIGSQGISIDGTAAQKASYLPRIATGELIGSFALTEPNVGSDAVAVQTRARRDGDHYVLNGTKRFITNAPRAGVFTVMARTDPDKPGAAGVSAFIVEAGTPGLSIGKPETKMGQKGSHVADVVFDDCRVPAANIIGGIEGRGFHTAMKVLDRGRLGIAAACTGFAERIVGESVDYAATRRQFGKAIADYQLIQAMIADSRTEALAARCMVLETARAKDAGRDVGIEASCCKLFASEMVGRVADRNVQIHGGAGYIADYPAERHYRDVRLYRIYEGTSEIQRLKIGRDTVRARAR